MKIIQLLGFTFIAIGTVTALNIKKILPITPKALDLTDHFGTRPTDEFYGPKLPLVTKLAREGSAPGDCIFSKPITNFGTQIVSSQVVSGDLTNIAPNAVVIKSAEIAGKNFI